MLNHRHHQTRHPHLRLLTTVVCYWVRISWKVTLSRILGGLFLAAFLFSRTIMPPQLTPSNMEVNAKRGVGVLKLLIITLEFRKATFSGNGVYAQSIARSLARKGHEVLVISGKPNRQGSMISNKSSLDNSDISDTLVNEEKSTEGHEMDDGLLRGDPESGISELEINVEQEGWGRLDWKCPWESFARGIAVFRNHVLRFNPSWVLVVDWSAVPAFQELSQSVEYQWRMAFLNFRIYTFSEFQGNNGETEKEFYKDMESKAVALASAVSALSSRDAYILATELGAGIKPGVVPKPHFPPLREDLRTIALNTSSLNPQEFENWMNGRIFLSCCVRISPEKNTNLFASLVEGLADFLRQQGIIPFLCGGAKGIDTYADRVKSRVKEAMPEAVIYEGFMDAHQLSDLYSRTLLNVHPCIYDAYGMTIVEAAAFRSPSVVHMGPGGEVGAAEFLNLSEGQVLGLDLTGTLSDIVGGMKGILLNKSELFKVGLAASQRSLSWDEDSNAQQLIDILESAKSIL